MVWVRKEYAGELAVVFTWLSGLLPWGVSWFRQDIADGASLVVTVINIRFPLFQFHYLFGISFGDQSLGRMVQLVHEIPDFVPTNQQFEGWLWIGAAAIYAGALLFSVLFYLDEDRVTDVLPIDPVRILGGALCLVGLVLSATSALLFVHQTTVPIGAIFMLVFGVLLLRVDRT